ncbi:MAG: LLM class F420-dependent oxidoreductase [Actinomycetota bacterium]
MDLVYDWPMGHGPDVDVFASGSVAEVAAALDVAGWHSIAFTEHPAPPAAWLQGGGHQSLDPFVALGAAAAATSRLRLLTYLAVAPYRNPVMLAKTAATLDVVSGGRLTLGLGTGYLKGEFRALGADFDTRNAGFDELLDVLPLHWSGEPFTYDGGGFSARDVIGLPAPVQRPIPVWIGGNAAVTRRRVAERAQGWMPLVAPPEVVAVTRTPAVTGVDDVAARVAEIRDLRGSDDFDVLYPYKDPDLADGIPVDEARHIDTIGRLTEAGVTAVALTGPGDGPLARTTEWIGTIGSILG